MLEQIRINMDLKDWQSVVEEFAKSVRPHDLSRALARLFNLTYPEAPHVSASGRMFMVTEIADPEALSSDPYNTAYNAMKSVHAAGRQFMEAFRIYDEATVVFEDETQETLKESRIWVPDVEKELLEYFRSHPEEMYSMPPRKFEELIAAVLKNQGLEVELTPFIKDGGIDIIAVERKTGSVPRVMLVECKRYAKENRVGLGIVQRLLGVVFDVRNIGEHGLLVTTSTFTGPAVQCAEANSHVLSLGNYYKVVEWLKGFDLFE